MELIIDFKTLFKQILINMTDLMHLEFVSFTRKSIWEKIIRIYVLLELSSYRVPNECVRMEIGHIPSIIDGTKIKSRHKIYVKIWNRHISMTHDSAKVMAFLSVEQILVIKLSGYKNCYFRFTSIFFLVSTLIWGLRRRPRPPRCLIDCYHQIGPTSSFSCPKWKNILISNNLGHREAWGEDTHFLVLLRVSSLRFNLESNHIQCSGP